MFQSQSEPWAVASLAELLALARAMEQEAIEEYHSLSRRMREMGRPELAAVFDSLVFEEEGHLEKVEDWRSALGQTGTPAPIHPPETLFDDEGAGIVAPELLSAYRAFSMAVRNEERAFVFWTYVSANARSDDIRQAAERMAREELGHIAKLRRERRKAFHLERDTSIKVAAGALAALEQRLSEHLRSMSRIAGAGGVDDAQKFAEQAELRAQSLTLRPLGIAPLSNPPSPAAVESPMSLSEFLTECYLDIADRSGDEDDTDRARSFAAEVIHSLGTIRSYEAVRRATS